MSQTPLSTACKGGPSELYQSATGCAVAPQAIVVVGEFFRWLARSRTIPLRKPPAAGGSESRSRCKSACIPVENTAQLSSQGLSGSCDSDNLSNLMPVCHKLGDGCTICVAAGKTRDASLDNIHRRVVRTSGPRIDFVLFLRNMARGRTFPPLSGRTVWHSSCTVHREKVEVLQTRCEPPTRKETRKATRLFTTRTLSSGACTSCN